MAAWTWPSRSAPSGRRHCGDHRRSMPSRSDQDTASFEIDAARRGRDGAGACGRSSTAAIPYLVAEHDGSVARLRLRRPLPAAVGYRHTVEDSIYLAAEARGQGIGGALLRRLIDDVRTGAASARWSRSSATRRTSPRSGCTRRAGFERGRHAHRRRLQARALARRVLMQRALGAGEAARAGALAVVQATTRQAGRSTTRSTFGEVVAALEDQAGRGDQRVGALPAGQASAA